MFEYVWLALLYQSPELTTNVTPSVLRSWVCTLAVYPTAIGSEPQDPTICSRDHWQRVMMGHAAANMVPVVASNRIGREEFARSHITFYGSSFITDNTGAKVQEADERTRSILVYDFDFAALRRTRAGWGLFRDRRPELYGPLVTHDGRTPFGKHVATK